MAAGARVFALTGKAPLDVWLQEQSELLSEEVFSKLREVPAELCAVIVEKVSRSAREKTINNLTAYTLAVIDGERAKANRFPGYAQWHQNPTRPRAEVQSPYKRPAVQAAPAAARQQPAATSPARIPPWAVEGYAKMQSRGAFLRAFGKTLRRDQVAALCALPLAMQHGISTCALFEERAWADVPAWLDYILENAKRVAALAPSPTTTGASAVPNVSLLVVGHSAGAEVLAMAGATKAADSMHPAVHWQETMVVSAEASHMPILTLVQKVVRTPLEMVNASAGGGKDQIGRFLQRSQTANTFVLILAVFPADGGELGGGVAQDAFFDGRFAKAAGLLGAAMRESAPAPRHVIAAFARNVPPGGLPEKLASCFGEPVDVGPLRVDSGGDGWEVRMKTPLEPVVADGFAATQSYPADGYQLGERLQRRSYSRAVPLPTAALLEEACDAEIWAEGPLSAEQLDALEIVHMHAVRDDTVPRRRMLSRSRLLRLGGWHKWPLAEVLDEALPCAPWVMVTTGLPVPDGSPCAAPCGEKRYCEGCQAAYSILVESPHGTVVAALLRQLLQTHVVAGRMRAEQHAETTMTLW